MYTHEDYILVFAAMILILCGLGLLGWIIEDGKSGIRILLAVRGRWLQRRQARFKEERLNEKVIRWVNKDAQARADRRRRIW